MKVCNDRLFLDQSRKADGGIKPDITNERKRWRKEKGMERIDNSGMGCRSLEDYSGPVLLE